MQSLQKNLKNLCKIEKQNNISINVFGNKDEIPYCIYTSNHTFEIYVDFLLLLNSKKYFL